MDRGASSYIGSGRAFRARGFGFPIEPGQPKAGRRGVAIATGTCSGSRQPANHPASRAKGGR